MTLATLFSMIVDFAILLVFLRFLMQLASIDRFNPVVIATTKATLVIDLLSKTIPTVSKGRVNLAALVVIVVLYLMKIAGVAHLTGEGIYSPVHLLLLTFVSMIQSLITFCRYLIFASIILSWVVMLSQSRSPYIDVIQDLAEPLLAPFRKILPDTGMIDLSPIVAIFALLMADMIMADIAKLLLMGY